MIDKTLVIEKLKNLSLPFHSSDQPGIAMSSVNQVSQENDTLKVSLSLPVPNLNLRRKCSELITECLEKAFPDHTIKVSISIGKGPLKDPSSKREKETPEGMKRVANIIAVASGKGGVGKSTLTSNIAVCLSKMGFKVGIVDADIFGPSIPLMFGAKGQRPTAIEVDGKSMIKTVERHGVKMLSMGFFLKENEAAVWRGPMASKALKQMLHDGHWEALDFMLVDLPPGTSDVHLSLVQLIPLTGALIVSTPQDIALEDARKGVGMFTMPSINIPVLGVVENMSYFSPPDAPEKRYHIFGKDGVKRFAEEQRIPFLGEIPLETEIREASDIGLPISLSQAPPATKAFQKICKALLTQILQRNTHIPPSEVVRITTMSGCSK